MFLNIYIYENIKKKLTRWNYLKFSSQIECFHQNFLRTGKCVLIHFHHRKSKWK